VTSRAQTYAEGKVEVIPCLPPRLIFPCLASLRNSRFGNEQDLAAFAESFDTGLKETFSDSSKPQFVKFGSLRDNDARCGVKSGKLNLAGLVLSPNASEVQCDISPPETK
jgi:hypothetical protein